MRLILTILICAGMVSAQDISFWRKRPAAGPAAISGCSGGMTATGSSGCVKRELFDGATSCYSGFSSNCVGTWAYANNVTFNSTTSPAPLQGTYSFYSAPANSNKAFMPFTAAADVYVGMAVNIAALPASTNIYPMAIDSNVDTVLCRMNFYGSGLMTVQATGGTQQETVISISTGTTYYIMMRATAGTGSNAACTAYLSTNGSSWTNSVSSTNGTWTANAEHLHIERYTSETGANIVLDDVRVSASSFNYW